MDEAIEKVTNILLELITLDAVVIIATIFFITEFFKQFFKGYSKTKSKAFFLKGIRPLEDWEIRGMALIIGVIITPPFMDGGIDFRIKLIYGMFYGGSTGIVIRITKALINKYFPKTGKVWSGQDKG